MNTNMIKIIHIDIAAYNSWNNHNSLISDNTVNTWQEDRSPEEKKADTGVGKKAEYAVELYIRDNLNNIEYIAYDNFRTNNFKKHAPFDGLLFDKKIDRNVVENLKKKINDEITKNKYGKISDSLKQELFKNEIYITEIKSTRITERHLSNSKIDLNKILQDDFLTYPKFLRSHESINSINEYIKYCIDKKYLQCYENENCFEKIKTIEFKNMQHIYIRVYIDIKNNDAYIIGFIESEQFISKLAIKRMKKINKSEYALYFYYPLKDGKDIDLLNNK